MYLFLTFFYFDPDLGFSLGSGRATSPPTGTTHFPIDLQFIYCFSGKHKQAITAILVFEKNKLAFASKLK